MPNPLLFSNLHIKILILLLRWHLWTIGRFFQKNMVSILAINRILCHTLSVQIVYQRASIHELKLRKLTIILHWTSSHWTVELIHNYTVLTLVDIFVNICEDGSIILGQVQCVHCYFQSRKLISPVLIISSNHHLNSLIEA